MYNCINVDIYVCLSFVDDDTNDKTISDNVYIYILLSIKLTKGLDIYAFTLNNDLIFSLIYL